MRWRAFTPRPHTHYPLPTFVRADASLLPYTTMAHFPHLSLLLRTLPRCPCLTHTRLLYSAVTPNTAIPDTRRTALVSVCDCTVALFGVATYGVRRTRLRGSAAAHGVCDSPVLGSSRCLTGTGVRTALARRTRNGYYHGWCSSSITCPHACTHTCTQAAST